MKFDRITFKTPRRKSYHLEIDHLNPNLLTAGSPWRIRMVSDYLKNSETFEGKRGLTVVSGEYEGLPVSALATGMGPASAAIVLPEALETARGPITMLRLGTCGSLQPHVKPGHLVISTGAVRDEMTTRAAVGPEYPAVASPELVLILTAAAEKRGYGLGKKLWVGITHTKDDLYFVETPHFSPSREAMGGKLASYKRMGVLASEMEFSVYCIMRDFYERNKRVRISVGALLAVLAPAPTRGVVSVGGAGEEAMERTLIRVGLDSLLMNDRLRKGRIEFDLNRVTRSILGYRPVGRVHAGAGIRTQATQRVIGSQVRRLTWLGYPGTRSFVGKRI